MQRSSGGTSAGVAVTATVADDVGTVTVGAADAVAPVLVATTSRVVCAWGPHPDAEAARTR
ncbi:MAG: hypothetical protein U0414_32735 [Polyangiaceae bacterium]